MTSNSSPKLDFMFVGPCKPGQFPWSPFGAKLEVRLKLSNPSLECNRITDGITLWRRAPHQKIPFIGLKDGTLLPDTTLCISHLISTGELEDWNSRLDGFQKSQDLSIRALVEDKLFFIYMWEVYHQPNYHTRMRDEGIWAPLAWPLRYLLFAYARYFSSKTLWRQGTGRFSPEEIRQFSTEILDSIDAIIKHALEKADRDTSRPVWILGGDHPTEADATVFGFFMSTLQFPRGRMSAEQVRARVSIMEYLERIYNASFSDYQNNFDP